VNLILLEPGDYIAPGRARLTDHRCAHIREILAAGVGATIKVGDLNGLMGSGEIVQCDAGAVELEVALDQPPPVKLPLTIILALPRPKMLRRVLRTVAELGVRDLILLNTYKVEKSYWQSPALAPAMIRHYFIEGLQQARDTVLPNVSLERLFKPFVEDRLPTIAAQTTGLVAHPGEAERCPVALHQECTLAIGPEGGFTVYEIKKLQEAGLLAVDMGPRILRVENALAALISRLFP
jgi:RsmE family RNA methyltransferase